MSNAQTTIELNKFIKKFNSDLKNFLPKSTNTLNKSINYSILAGGKRFRPFLIYTFAKVLKVSPSNAIKIGKNFFKSELNFFINLFNSIVV